MGRFSLRKAIMLSVVLHILFFAGTSLVKALRRDAPEQALTIDFISPQELAAFENAEEKKITPKKNLTQQIVDQKGPEAQPPADTRFLSEKDQKVEKQTIARHRGEFKNSESNKKAGALGPRASANQAKKAEEAPSKPDLFATYDPTEGFQRQKEQSMPKVAGQGGENGQGDVSQTNDYIKDVDQGLHTLLNTREFKYYSYYNRIRKQLSQHWEGNVRERLSKLFREGRAPAATSQDRITKVVVVLNHAGTLVRVQIISDSGVRDLDEAAVEAFRAAAPFPNPPKGLVEADGTVKIRWDFVLES